MGTRFLIIKLAAAGDVLRTTSILEPLKRKYPESHVTWVTDANALPLIALNPYIDRAVPLGFEAALTLLAQRFDVVICLDKEPRAGALMNLIKADRKLGFGLSEWGTIEPVSAGAQYDFQLGLSDDRKFNENRKGYPEIFCQIADVDYAGEPYVLVLPDQSIEYANRFVRELGPETPLVGLNVGAGRVFANKAWTPSGYAALAVRISDDLGGTALLLGGADEQRSIADIVSLSKGAAIAGGQHTLLDFAAIVGKLDALVTGDTMALHLAVALRVPVVALFGPTACQEIELFGLGSKVTTTVDCAPCYRRSCDLSPSCMDAIGVDDVFTALVKTLESRD
jgi:heptosyltransferase-2